MKRFLKYMLLLLPLTWAGGCSRQKMIPNDTLAEIMSDMFIANAYANKQYSMVFDSIDIYEPILNEYGYTSRDFTSTLADFTKRKSAKISQVIEAANTILDHRLAVATARTDRLNYMDSVAWRYTKRTVYEEPLIEVRKVEDTALLRIIIPASAGRYEITYNYMQDSLDTNHLISRHQMKDSTNRVTGNTTERVIRGREKKGYTTKLESPANAKQIELLLGNYSRQMTEPHYTVDSLTVVWFPPKDISRGEYLHSVMDKKLIKADSIISSYDTKLRDRRFQTDSSSLYILPPLLPPEGDSNTVE